MIALKMTNYFGNYTLSEETLDKLRGVDSLLKSDLCPADMAWSIIKPKIEKKADPENIVEQEVQIDVAEDIPAQASPILATQFFCSQRDRKISTPIHTGVEIVSEWSDAAESLRESLETTGDTLDLRHLKSLSDEESESVLKYLSEKLSLKGTYNFCRSMCALSPDESIRYIKTTCSTMLLDKIILLKEPSRLLNTAIQEMVQKFPDDVQEFVYSAMLNAEIRDTSAFLSIINSWEPHRKNDLLLKFLTTVQELKEWHISILSQLVTSKLSDNISREKLLDLLVEKASVHSREKNYGKFVLSFMKLNNPFTDSEKTKLTEIVAVNETIFKRVMISLVNNMYLYGELWHIA